MITKINQSEIYTIGDFTKTANCKLTIDGVLNSNGNVTISGGTNLIGSSAPLFTYEIACVNKISLSNGVSYGNIVYGSSGSANIDSTWDPESYSVYSFNDLPGLQASSDLIGYLEYLLSITATGTPTYSGNTCTISGQKTTSINAFDIESSDLIGLSALKFSTRSESTILAKVNAPDTVVSLNNLTISSNYSPAHVVCAIDAKTINITNSIIIGTIYAPNSDIIISKSTITGAIYANSITIIGDTVIASALFTGSIPEPSAPVISVKPESSLDNYNPISVTISATVHIPPYYEIRYTLDGTGPTTESDLYSIGFSVYAVGIVTIRATLFGKGVPDGNSASQAYGFNCSTESPSLEKSYDSSTGVYTYSISHEDGSIVHYTLDGSNPTNTTTSTNFLYNQQSFQNQFANEGEYTIRFVAQTPGCDISSIVEETFIVDLPKGALQPPTISIQLADGTNVPYTIDASGTILTTTSKYLISDSKKMTFTMSSTAGSSIKYSLDETSPLDGIAYNGELIAISDLGFNYLRAYTHQNNVEYSKQLKIRFIILTSDTVYFDNSAKDILSEEVLDSMQTGSSYAMDIAWVGPGVVTDDFCVYQALINILATEMFERIFNPSFGVSITSQLAEINEQVDSVTIVENLKAEVEAQDSRISINENMSMAYYDESIEAVVVNIYWTNLVTNNSATLKYAYDLNTIL